MSIYHRKWLMAALNSQELPIARRFGFKDAPANNLGVKMQIGQRRRH
jgi:hypothetical protein